MKVIDEVPNRTEKLIPMVAEALGDTMHPLRRCQQFLPISEKGH